MSVTGPQNRLTQYTGVEKTATMGGWVASAAAMVEWCSSGSGTVPSDARESIALGGTSLAPSVWFCVGSAASRGDGVAARDHERAAGLLHPPSDAGGDLDLPDPGAVECDSRGVH